MQIDTDVLSFDDLFPGGYLIDASQIDSAIHPMTCYIYDPNVSNSPDQPSGITDASGQTQYFRYNANNEQIESWTHWIDPASIEADKFIFSVPTMDDQGRVIESRQIVAADENRQTVLSDVPQSYTHYGSTGQADWTLDYTADTLTQYAADETAQTVEILTWQVTFDDPGDKTADSFTAGVLLTGSRMLYDAEGRGVVSVGPYECDAYGEPVGEPVGTETVYDALGRVVETRRWANVRIQTEDIVVAGQTVGLTATGWTTNGTQPDIESDNLLSCSRTEYDPAGRVWKTYTQNDTGTEICTAEYVYDLAGRQIRTISLPGTPDETEAETQYNGSRRDYVTDAQGNTTSFIYDDLGRVITTVYPPSDYVDESGASVADANTYTHVAYDGLGRKQYEMSGVSFDDMPAVETDAFKDNAKEYVYNISGALSRVILPQVQDPADSQTKHPYYDYLYDDYGNMIGIIDAKDRLTVFEYDHFNRQRFKYMPFEITPAEHADLLDGDTDVYTLATAALPLYEEKVYDDANFGRLLYEMDYKQQVVEYAYDTRGRLEYKYYYDADGDLDGDNENYLANPQVYAEYMRYTYDVLGRQDVIYKDGEPEQDYDYDNEGNLQEITTPQGTITYGYNSITGQNPTSTVSDNTSTTYAYDDLGRLDSVNDTTQYTYTAVGSRQSVSLPNGVYTHYAYNNLNRLTSLVHFESSQMSSVISSYDYTLKADGMRKQAAEYIEKASGADEHTVDYSYDNLNRLESETVGADYDVSYTYDLAGNRKTRTVNTDNGTLVTTYYHDSDTDRLLTEVHEGPIATVAWHDDKPVTLYASADGGTYYRLPGSQRKIGHLEAWFYGLPSVFSRYILLALAVITLAVLLGPSSGVLYRRLRRMPRAKRPRLSVYHRTLCLLLAWVFLIGPEMFQQAAYADSQYTQVSTFTWANGNHTIEYDYDDNGSLISKITYKRIGQDTEFVEGRRYDYDLQNRLAKLWDMGSDETDPADDEPLAEYYYNTAGIRTEKIDYEASPAQLTTYLIDPVNHTGYAQVLEETTYEDDGQSGWTPVSRIQYTIGDDVLAQTTSTYSSGWSAGDTKYLLYDGHGSTRQLVGENQAIQQSYNYDAYGTLLQDSAAESSPGITPQQDTSMLYAGEQYDTSGQMYYNRARYYNPLNGTFNRTDPYAGNTQDPQSLHKYAYCHNNPVNAIDPSGEFSITEVLIVSVIMIIAFNATIVNAPGPNDYTWSDNSGEIIIDLAWSIVIVTGIGAVAAGGRWLLRTPRMASFGERLVKCVPKGFQNTKHFKSICGRIRTAAGRADDVVVGIRGSSVTGQSHNGVPFDVGRTSDLDMFVVSDDLFDQAVKAGAKVNKQGMIGYWETKRVPELYKIQGELSKELGRETTIRIYSSQGFEKIAQKGGYLIE